MFTFTLFDVGHGFCAYATTPGGSNLLFDCGYDDELEFYPSRYFSDRNITRIHTLVLSHFDQDHVCLSSCAAQELSVTFQYSRPRNQGPSRSTSFGRRKKVWVV